MQHPEISKSEAVIMELMKKGFTNHKISTELNLSVNTVKYHLKRMYKKLGANNRVEAINHYNRLKDFQDSNDTNYNT